jgi:hypothetical protein
MSTDPKGFFRPKPVSSAAAIQFRPNLQGIAAED